MTDTTRPRLTLITGGLGHEIMPDPATVTRERDGEPGAILDPSAYPLAASCSRCAEPIRCQSFYGDWHHAAPAVPGPRSEASR